MALSKSGRRGVKKEASGQARTRARVKKEGEETKDPAVKTERREASVKRESKENVKNEGPTRVKKEEDGVKREPIHTRSQKRIRESSVLKSEKKTKHEGEVDEEGAGGEGGANDSFEVPKKAAGYNQDTRDGHKRKWQVVPAQEGRFILSPSSMSWIKVGSDSYNALLATPVGRSYLQHTPVVKMDGRRWGTYGPPSSQVVRRKLPANLFLIPELRKYPVATKAGEKPWSSGLRAAMARARLPISRNPKIYAKALDLMYAHYQDEDQSLPGVKNRGKLQSSKAKALSRLLSDRLAAHPHSRPEDMPPLEKFAL